MEFEANLSWIDSSIEHVLERVNSTLKMRLRGFPHFAETNGGKWTTTPDGDWTGGHWVGMLWLAYLYTREKRYERLAMQWAKNLKPRLEVDTIFKCDPFYYGIALGDILFHDISLNTIAIEAAESIWKTFNHSAGLFPLGTMAEEVSDVGLTETNVDSVKVIGILGWAAQKVGRDEYRQTAIDHAKKLADFCIMNDGSVIQSASFDVTSGQLVKRYTHKAYSQNSIWARAQAWAMYSYAMAAYYAPEEKLFIDTAVKVSDWWIAHISTDLVSFWDFSDPGIPNVERDTSATSLAATSLFKISGLLGTNEKARVYREFAEKSTLALVNGYLTPVSENDRRPRGILMSGCYNKRIGLATNNELIWGDYYLLESLLKTKGILDPALV